MNKKMIEILMSCGFTQDEEGKWTLSIYEDRYMARAEDDCWGDARVLVFELYYNELGEEECDDSEGVDFTEFILHYFE